MYKIKPWQIGAALMTVIIAVVIFIGCRVVIINERMLGQSIALSEIARDAMLFRATPQRIADRVTTDLHTSVGFSPEDVGEDCAVALPAQTFVLGMGGRWILNMKLGKDGKCEQAWLEMQPVGYP